MPDVSFNNLLVVSAVAVARAVAASGFLPGSAHPRHRAGDRRRNRARTVGARLGRAWTCRSRSWHSSDWRSCCSWRGWRSTCTVCAAGCCDSHCSAPVSPSCSALGAGAGFAAVDGLQPLLWRSRSAQPRSAHRARAQGRRPGRQRGRADAHRRGLGGRLRRIVLLSLFFSTSGGSTGSKHRAAGGLRRCWCWSPPSPSCRRPVDAAQRGTAAAAGHHRRDPGPVRCAAAGRLRRAGRAVRPGEHPGRVRRGRGGRLGRPGRLRASPSAPSSRRSGTASWSRCSSSAAACAWTCPV